MEKGNRLFAGCADEAEIAERYGYAAFGCKASPQLRVG